MSKKLLSYFAVNLVLVSGFVLCPSQTAAAKWSQYVVVEFLGSGFPSTVGMAINNHGHTAGSYLASDGIRHPFLWKDGVMQDLGILEDATWCRVLDMNDDDQVVGECHIFTGVPNEDVAIAFYYDEIQGMVNLGVPLGYDHSEAVGINSLGQIIVNAEPTAGRGIPFLYDFSLGWQELPTLDPVWTENRANDINDNGEVVGTSQATVPNNEWYNHAFIWDAVNGIRDLHPDYNNAQQSVATAIDNSGRVGMEVTYEGNTHEAYFWEGGEWSNAPGTRVVALNNVGQALTSYCGVPSNAGLYLDGQNIYNYLPSGNTWVFDSCYSINDLNDQGQMVGYATLNGEGDIRAVLLQPVPEIEGMADFGGDGKPDLLMRNYTPGTNPLWHMDGVDVSLKETLARVGDRNWEIAATADMNSDNNPDLVWRNSQNGNNYIWYMNGSAIIGGDSIPQVPQPSWAIADAVDFNGDDKPDLLWRNTEGNDNYIWFMDGSTVTGGACLPTAAQVWDLAAVADFDGDGDADLLWRHGDTGANFLWYMEGPTATGGASLPFAGPDWDIVGAADFNEDGMPDLAWKHAGTCDTYVWYMNGVTPTGGAPMPNLCEEE